MWREVTTLRNKIKTITFTFIWEFHVTYLVVATHARDMKLTYSDRLWWWCDFNRGFMSGCATLCDWSLREKSRLYDCVFTVVPARCVLIEALRLCFYSGSCSLCTNRGFTIVSAQCYVPYALTFECVHLAAVYLGSSLYAWWANRVKGGYWFAKDSKSPAVLLHARVFHSFRHSYWLVFIFRSRKSFVLPTKQRAWRQPPKTDWKPRNSSLSQFPSHVQSSLRL